MKKLKPPARPRDARSIPLNPFEEQKRKLEEKKKREAEEEAAIYASFVSSFNGDDAAGAGKRFVRAGESRPPAPPPPSAATAPSISSAPSGLQSVFDMSAAPSAPRKKKTKNIDLFLEELKREAEHDKTENPPRAPPIHPAQVMRGSFSGDGDLQSTNLYVGNLAPTVNETKLLMEFGKFGPIGSVKVMWPRSSEEMSRTASKCGFVCFMRREDAADALRELQGFEMDGQPLRMNWGKAVPTPAEALPMPSAIGAAPAPNLDLTFSVSKEQCKIMVIPPADKAMRTKIDLAAEFTAKHGVQFERALMEDRPDWDFLFDRSSADHIYYRWRVYSLSQGDSLTNWRTAPFTMTCHGPLWVAPPLPGTESSSAVLGVKNRSGLPDPARDKLLDLLDDLTTDRRKICFAMGFAMDNADFSAEIISEIDSYFQKESVTDVVPKVIALLYLVSDILHNSSSATVRNAWNFRNQLQTHLVGIFERLHQVYFNIDGRLSAENMKEKVVKVLRVWRSWSVYPSEFMTELEDKFSGKQEPTKSVPSADKPEDEDIDGQALSDDDIDGVPLF